ncbi:MAG: Spy/CpxP family protein refolding chaperone [Methyloceanibacter sp.]
MWKTVLAVTVAALVSGSGLVLAREMSDREDGPHWQPSAEDMKAFTDARVAALKAGLELKPEQEKNWPAVEAAIRDMAKARADRIAARANEQPPSDPVERLHRRAERLGTVATGLKKLADAEEPLYKSLDDAQKQRFEILTRALRPHHHMGFAGWQKHGWSDHGDRDQEPGHSRGDSKQNGSGREL